MYRRVEVLSSFSVPDASSQPSILRDTPDGLPHSEVSKHILRTTQQSVKRYRSVIVLDEPTHARTRDPSATKQLDGVPCRILRGACGVRLKEGDLAHEFDGLLFVRL
jgi:hypothetical protein